MFVDHELAIYYYKLIIQASTSFLHSASCGDCGDQMSVGAPFKKGRLGVLGNWLLRHQDADKLKLNDSMIRLT